MPQGMSLKTRALAHLARREHSRLELERKLAPHAQTSEELENVLDVLEQCGALSPARVVEQVLHMRRSRFGSQRIVRELREKGIAENLIAEQLPNMKEAEQSSAYEVWRKKFGAMPANAREFGRQMRFMRGRGFAPETISRVLRHTDEEE
ncbi:regulatory protein [Nitrosovibrio tenuis]|uniref:Regulatory protein RecX n=2 Tax=Nitrosovibrio tenuis TaxID=1233 RepID=A0A1H7RAS2_9PROT|nr:regulatory protein [Nitrosovibrio tenuis]